jgi:hypothetical protein
MTIFIFNDQHTKMDVLRILVNVAKYSKITRSKLRLALFENREWFEDNYYTENLFPEKVNLFC